MAYFEHEGCSLHYEVYGQGEPLVLLHGLVPAVKTGSFRCLNWPVTTGLS